MKDSISRQAMLDEIKERLNANRYSNAALVSELIRLYGYAKLLPTNDPAENGGCWGCCCEKLGQVEIVKRGKWIHDDFGWHCSECWAMYPEEITDEINYCPNCGARCNNFSQFAK